MNLAAGVIVPILIAFMAWAFSTFMLIKGLGAIFRLPIGQATLVGLLVAIATWLVVRRPLSNTANQRSNTKDGVNSLFTWPLIFAAALLSFAHGANDVANAIGPLAAVYEAMEHGVVASRAATPLWILILGAIGLAIGLILFGANLIRTVGKEITEIDRMRAYSIAMAAAVTVIVAAQLGMPVSTTHVTIGALFGVGFLREFLKTNYAKMEQLIIAGHQGEQQTAVESYLSRFEAAPINEKKEMLAEMKQKAKLAHMGLLGRVDIEGATIDRTADANSTTDSESINEIIFAKRERKAMRKVYQQQLVKRSMVLRIVAAWVITVPATALLSAGLYLLIERLTLF